MFLSVVWDFNIYILHNMSVYKRHTKSKDSSNHTRKKSKHEIGLIKFQKFEHQWELWKMEIGEQNGYVQSFKQYHSQMNYEDAVSHVENIWSIVINIIVFLFHMI